MRTKLTFLIIAIAALVGVGMLMAFKADSPEDQYRSIWIVSPADESQTHLLVIGDNRIISDEIIPDKRKAPKWNYQMVTSKKVNELYKEGYRLIGAEGYVLHFEKK